MSTRNIDKWCQSHSLFELVFNCVLQMLTLDDLKWLSHCQCFEQFGLLTKYCTHFLLDDVSWGLYGVGCATKTSTTYAFSNV